jgi:uncharacterized protein YdaU (DUF1376 family)
MVLGNPKRCWRRASFATWGMAILVAKAAMTRKRNQDDPVQMSVYFCPHCNRWHLVRCKKNAANIPEELKVWDGNPTNLSRSEQDALLARVGAFSCQPRT